MSNNAVEIINEHIDIDSLLQNQETCSRNDLIKATLSRYSGASYGNANWTKVYPEWGNRPEVITLNGEFASKYPTLEQLNLDPGLITHLPEFLEFLDETQPDISDYLKLRDAFKQHLGNRTVWRGMVLEEFWFEKIKTNGIGSPFMRAIDWNNNVGNFEYTLSTCFDKLIDKHFHNELYQSPLVSVTSHEDVAIALGRHFGRAGLFNKSGEFYLFKLSIPEIDLIYYTDHAVRIPSKVKEANERGTKLRVSVNDVENSYPMDRHVESYVLHKIDLNEIVEISKPDVHISTWNGQTLSQTRF